MDDPVKTDGVFVMRLKTVEEVATNSTLRSLLANMPAWGNLLIPLNVSMYK